jgi:6-pyruvoyltetrahydropterin/6-carboxytetrahydropterin synthase
MGEAALSYRSTKTYTHSVGLSCCFRQWRAEGYSHCSFLHGYAIEVKLVFASDTLDERNWVQDFGGLKDVKKFLEETFDHTCVVAEDDPKLALFQAMHDQQMIQLVILPAVGCEKFAEYIFRYIEQFIPAVGKLLESVEVREHQGNSASVHRKDLKPERGVEENH